MIGRRVASAILALEEEVNPAVVELATLLSLSSRIEPELLRAIRLAAAPQLHAGVEGDLWFSPLVASRGPDAIAFHPEVLELLRRRLRDEVKRETVEQVWRVTQRLHQDLSPALALEERVAWHALAEASTSTQAIEDELSRALVTLIEEARPGVARWVAQAWPRLPAEARSTRTAWQLKEAARPYLGAYRIRADEAPEGLGEVDLRATVERLPDVRLTVRRAGRLIQLGRVPPGRTVAIRVPDTDPRLVELRWTEADRGRTELVQVRPGRAAHHPVGFGPVELRTLRGELYQLPGRRPVAVSVSSAPTDGQALAGRLASELLRHGFRLERPPDRGADILVLLLTPDALRSPALQAAWRADQASGKPVLSAIVEVTTDELPEELRSLQHLDLRGLDLDEAVARLLAGIDTITEALPDDEREPTPAPARTSDLDESLETSAMSGLLNTFGGVLLLFARSVDIVDERTLEEVRRLVYRYVEKELQATYFSLETGTTVNGQPALQTFWSTRDETHTTTVRTPGGDYSAQISVAFDRRTPLWIVDPEQRPLRVSDEYVDLWSDVHDLPRYQAPRSNRDMRTSIVVPLVHWGDVLGVMLLESTSYLDVTDVAKDELSRFGEALAILFGLYRTSRAQAQGRDDAISELQTILRESRFPRLTKPQIFVASSPRADDAVRGVIQEVLDEFSTRLAVVQWDRIEASGSISLQLVEQIAASRFGLCYFSEPAPDGRAGYVDNPNVLFEAGMLHSLTNTPIGRPSGWVPVRERSSPRIPFDFATERVLEVPRDAGGEVLVQRFRDVLRKRMMALLSEAAAR